MDPCGDIRGQIDKHITRHDARGIDRAGDPDEILIRHKVDLHLRGKIRRGYLLRRRVAAIGAELKNLHPVCFVEGAAYDAGLL